MASVDPDATQIPIQDTCLIYKWVVMVKGQLLSTPGTCKRCLENVYSRPETCSLLWNGVTTTTVELSMVMQNSLRIINITAWCLHLFHLYVLSFPSWRPLLPMCSCWSHLWLDLLILPLCRMIVERTKRSLILPTKWGRKSLLPTRWVRKAGAVNWWVLAYVCSCVHCSP